MNFGKRVFSYFLLSLLLSGQILPVGQKVFGSEVTTDEPDLRKSWLDDKNPIAQAEKKICIRSFCIDKGQLTETFLAKQIREIAEKNAPVTVSSNNLYPLVSSLPGDSFRPSILDLQGASSEQVIPAGDYIIPVKVYYMQKVASNPNGHRYLLGKYGGYSKDVLAALNQAAAGSNVPHNDLQNLSWAIQAGVSYKQMPSQMQALVDNLIPRYRSVFKPEWWEEIERIWNKSSQALRLASLQEFLSRHLGDAGRNLLAVKQVRDRFVAHGNNKRDLSDIFLLNDGTPGEGNVLATRWSQLGDGVYARFVTEGNGNDTGLLMLRVTGKVSQKNQTTSGTKGLPLLQMISTALTVYELYQIITNLVALPEGNQKIQPLIMSPDLLAVTKDFIDIGINVCERSRTPQGRLSRAIDIVCSVANGTPRITQLKKVSIIR
jgi:hypothetical protein